MRLKVEHRVSKAKLILILGTIAFSTLGLMAILRQKEQWLWHESCKRFLLPVISRVKVILAPC